MDVVEKVVQEETVEELGLCDASKVKVTVVFKKNEVPCPAKSGFGIDVDPEALVMVNNRD